MPAYLKRRVLQVPRCGYCQVRFLRLHKRACYR